MQSFVLPQGQSGKDAAISDDYIRLKGRLMKSSFVGSSDRQLAFAVRGSRNRRASSVLALAAVAMTGGLSLIQPAAWAQTTGAKVITITPGTSAAQIAKQLRTSVAAAQQIQSIDADKQSWTPAQRKMTSDLIFAARMAAGKPAAPGVATLDTGITPDAKGRVKVSVFVKSPTPAILNAISTLNGELVINSGSELVVNLPLANIETLAGRTDVLGIHTFVPPKLSHSLFGRSTEGFKPRPFAPYIRKPRMAYQMRSALQAALTKAGFSYDPFSVSGPLSNILLSATDYNGANTGVIGEGVTTHDVATAYARYGVSGYNSVLGRNIRIGVMSDGTGIQVARKTGLTTDDYLADSQTTSDLPPTDSTTYGTNSGTSVTVAVDDTQSPSVTQTGPSNNSGEGTAMMQIVHDMIPTPKSSSLQRIPPRRSSQKTSSCCASSTTATSSATMSLTLTKRSSATVR